jgi:hypothetical protein
MGRALAHVGARVENVDGSAETLHAGWTRAARVCDHRRMRRTWRRALGGLVGMGIVTAASAPARATDSLGGVLVKVAVTALIADVSFAVHGISVAGKGKLPSASWSIAETVVTVPQTIAANVLYVGLASNDSDGDNDGLRAAWLVPTIGVSILSTHGIWATATTNVRPGVLAGSSIAVGADIALTSGVLSSLGAGRLPGRPAGVTTMLFTAPQVAAASYLAATSPSSSRGGWIGLGAWSGTLFVYGLVAAIRGHGGDHFVPVDAPPLPPPPPPPRPAKTPLLPPPAPIPDNRPPLMVPESLRIGPTIVSDGVATAMGIGISGVLF